MDAISSWFTSVPLDWFIPVICAVLITLDALRGSTARAAALALALPSASLLAGFVSNTAYFSGVASGSPMVQGGVFLALVIALFVLSYRMMGFSDNSGPLQALLAGLGTTLIAVSIWTSSESLQSLWEFGPSISAVFSDSYRLMWILAGLVLVGFARK